MTALVMTLAAVTSSAVLTVWWWSLAILAVVIVVVAVLLIVIDKTAGAILDGVAAIWTQGKLVANNTIQIPLLLSITGRGVGAIRGVAGEIAGATAAIQRHAETCPGCPHCVLGGGARS